MPWRNTASQTTDVRLDPKALMKEIGMKMHRYKIDIAIYDKNMFG